MKLTNAQVEAIVPLLEVYAADPGGLRTKLSAKKEVKMIDLDDLLYLTIRYTGVGHIVGLRIHELSPGDRAVDRIPGALALCQQVQYVLAGTQPPKEEVAPSSRRVSIWERLNTETPNEA